MEDRRNGQRVHLILYHRVWTPKRRQAVLKDAIVVDGRRLIAQVCAERRWEMVEPVIPPDPIHLLVRVWPSVSAADGVKAVTDLPSHNLRARSAVVRKLLSIGIRSSFVATVGKVSNETVRRDLETHKGPEAMLTSFRSCLVPSTPHARRLERSLEPCCRQKNRGRAERRDASRKRGELIDTVRQIARVKELKASAPSAKNVHRHVLHIVVTDLDKALRAFFRRVKAGRKNGIPSVQGPQPLRLVRLQGGR